MAEKQRVEVEILGQKYTIRSEAAPEYVRELAAFVERRAREIRRRGPGAGPGPGAGAGRPLHHRRAVPTREERKEQDVDHKDVTARLGALRQLLDAVVPGEVACTGRSAWGRGYTVEGPALFVMSGESFNLV